MSDNSLTPTDEILRRAKGRHFLLEPSLWPAGGFPKIEFANETRLWRPGWYFIEPPTGAPDQYPERPHLVHEPKGRKANGLPRDFEMFAGLWIVSKALKQVFQAVDPEAFAFAACDFTLSDGSAGPELHLCGVLRELDALNEAASRLKIKTGDYVNGKYYSRAGGAALVFRPEVVGRAHVFRTPYSDAVFCDREMRDALVRAGLKGIGLRDATDC
ncbi:MAG: DUF1629 domain-containing protein [Tabrizicola sp.]